MKSKLFTMTLLIVYIVCAACFAEAAQPTKQELIDMVGDGQQIYNMNAVLADDSMLGRHWATGGEDLSAFYVSNMFKTWELSKKFNEKDYFLEFTHVTWHPTGDAKFELLSPGGYVFQYGAHEDYITLPFSGNCNVTSDIVFVGYGLDVAGDSFSYNDYATVDVTNKIVLIIHGAPPNLDLSQCSSEVPLPGDLSPAVPRAKAIVAEAKGAKGVILAWTPWNPYLGDNFIRCSTHTLGNTHYQPEMGVLQAKINSIQDHLMPDIQIRKAYIDANTQPNSCDLGKIVAMQTQVLYDDNAKSKNIVGVIRGSHPTLKEEKVYVVAHRDHHGIRSNGSTLFTFTTPNGQTVSMMGDIFPGAVDNGSGTATLMEIARIMATSKFKPNRTIVFLNTAAEEQSLLGAYAYVDGLPQAERDNIVAAISIEMTGRGDMLGLSAANFIPELTPTNLFDVMASNVAALGIPNYGFTGYTTHLGSDNDAFELAGIPAVMFAQEFGALFKYYYYFNHTIHDGIAENPVKNSGLEKEELAAATKALIGTVYDVAMDEDFVAIPSAASMSKQLKQSKPHVTLY